MDETAMVVADYSYNLEHRAYREDAWYDVCVAIEENETLRIRYKNFSDEHDNLFTPSDFDSLEKLHDFGSRFRRLSRQIQDNECRELVVGVKVCACRQFGNEEVRFYDAILDEVHRSEHSFKRTEEKCHCTFILNWLHGPNAGTLTADDVENICIVQPALEVDPVVASFLQMGREKIKLISGQEIVAYCHNSSMTHTPCRLGSVEGKQKGKRRRPRQSVSGACSSEVGFLDGRKEDRNFGGNRNVCMILMENLERELCPSTVVEFLRRHTLLSATVFIFPSLSAEVYTKGAIMLDSEKHCETLCDFLTNPNYIITSATGRPWVVGEKIVGLKKIQASIGTLEAVSKNVSQSRKNEKSNKLEIVYSGSEEFKIASDLRDLFLEFSDHQKRLHRKLSLLERSMSIEKNV